MSEIEELLRAVGYSTKAITFYLTKVNVGTWADADICDSYTGPCGDTMEFFLKIASNRITDAQFQALGCEGAFICGSAVTEMVKGMSLSEARCVEPDQVIAYLGGVPEDKHDCACLAVRTLQKALEKFNEQPTIQGEHMKVAISAQGNNLQAAVDPRMGRAQQFLLVDTESLAYEAVENPNLGASGGAGIQTAQFLASKGVQAVITGNCGPNAFATFQAAGIQVYIGASGTIQQALEQYQKGQLQLANQPNVGGHFGSSR